MLTETVPTQEIETIDSVLTRSWLYYRQLVVYNVTTPILTRRTIDTIYDTIWETMDGWSAERPYLALQVFNQEGLMPTPYAQHRAAQLANAFPDIFGRVATILSKTPARANTQKWLDHLSHTRQLHLPHRIFFSKQEGMCWLLEMLPKTH
jgi:hypothetical protein